MPRFACLFWLKRIVMESTNTAFDIYLVRHGEAAAAWTEHRDPGLSRRGSDQAAAVVATLGRHTPMAILTSPLKRARETAMPLAEHWGVAPVVDETFREIPSSVPMTVRPVWLRQVMQSSWVDIDEKPILAWRENACTTIREMQRSTVIFTHFMLINAVVSAATNDENTVCFEPDNGSITQLHLSSGHLELFTLGTSRNTKIL